MALGKVPWPRPRDWPRQPECRFGLGTERRRGAAEPEAAVGRAKTPSRIRVRLGGLTPSRGSEVKALAGPPSGRGCRHGHIISSSFSQWLRPGPRPWPGLPACQGRCRLGLVTGPGIRQATARCRDIRVMRQGIANDSDFTNKCNRCGFDFESGLACRIFGLIIVKLLSGIGCCRVFPTVQAIYSLPVIDIGRGRADIRNCSASYKNARLHVRFRRIAVHLLCAVSFIKPSLKHNSTLRNSVIPVN